MHLDHKLDQNLGHLLDQSQLKLYNTFELQPRAQPLARPG